MIGRDSGDNRNGLREGNESLYGTLSNDSISFDFLKPDETNSTYTMHTQANVGYNSYHSSPTDDHHHSANHFDNRDNMPGGDAAYHYANQGVSEEKTVLKLTIRKATRVVPRDMFGRLCPYVLIELNKEVKKSRQLDKPSIISQGDGSESREYIYGDSFVFRLSSNEQAIIFKVLDGNCLGEDQIIGEGEFPMSLCLSVYGEGHFEVPLISNAAVTGYVHFSVTVKRPATQTGDAVAGVRRNAPGSAAQRPLTSDMNYLRNDGLPLSGTGHYPGSNSGMIHENFGMPYNSDGQVGTIPGRMPGAMPGAASPFSSSYAAAGLNQVEFPHSIYHAPEGMALDQNAAHLMSASAKQQLPGHMLSQLMPNALPGQMPPSSPSPFNTPFGNPS